MGVGVADQVVEEDTSKELEAVERRAYASTEKGKRLSRRRTALALVLAFRRDGKSLAESESATYPQGRPPSSACRSLEVLFELRRPRHGPTGPALAVVQ